MRKDFKPPKHVDSQQSTTDIFMQDTVISGITLWTYFSLDIAKFNAKQKHPGCKKRRGQSEAAVIK